MLHPDPLLLCQHVLFTTDAQGRPTCLYRNNSLNLSTLWAHPVPTSLESGSPTLVFSKYVAPLEVYLPHLLATQHHPADTPARQITPTADSLHLFSTSDPSAALRDFNPRHRGGRLGSTEYQSSLTALRNRTACALVHKFLKKDMSGMQAISTAALRIGMSAPLLQRVLYEQEGLSLIEINRPRNSRRAEHLPRLSGSHEYRYMFAEIQRAVQTVRTRKEDDLGAFSIHDLCVEGEPGGYPRHCPVTGAEFVWGEPAGASMFSPKVGRIDPRENYVPGNVLLMSKVAKRVLERTGEVKKIAAFMRENPDMLNQLQEWLGDKPYHPANDFVAAIRNYLYRKTTNTNTD